MKPELYLLVLQAYQNISALVCRRRRKGETETSLYSRSTGIRKKTYAKFSLGCSFFWTDYASTFFEVSRAVVAFMEGSLFLTCFLWFLMRFYQILFKWSLLIANSKQRFLQTLTPKLIDLSNKTVSRCKRNYANICNLNPQSKLHTTSHDYHAIQKLRFLLKTSIMKCFATNYLGRFWKRCYNTKTHIPSGLNTAIRIQQK